jgi:hypothetical protein
MVQRPRSEQDVARGGVGLKSNRESFGTWEVLVSFISLSLSLSLSFFLSTSTSPPPPPRA